MYGTVSRHATASTAAAVGGSTSSGSSRGSRTWELVSLALDADLKGKRDGHLLVFKREVAIPESG
jgi:hypothetical protein